MYNAERRAWERAVIASTLIVPMLQRGHAARDALRHKWHRLRIR